MEENKKSILEDNLRHDYIRVVWSHKIQEKQADIEVGLFKLLEFIRQVCNIGVSAGIVYIIFGDNQTAKIITALISIAASLFPNGTTRLVEDQSSVKEANVGN